MKQIIYATPAYGRRYDTIEAFLKDWNEGKDFRIDRDGPYFSIRDAKKLAVDFILCASIHGVRHLLPLIEETNDYVN